jgi:hypothetical protein
MHKSNCNKCEYYTGTYCQLLDHQIGDSNDPDCNYHDDINEM